MVGLRLARSCRRGVGRRLPDMGQITSANVVQAKTGSITTAIDHADVTLDNPTTAGNTLTIQMVGPALYPGMPAGFEYDWSYVSALWSFRYSDMPGGETSWAFTTVGPIVWAWRVIEWDIGLDPYSPFECGASNIATGSGVTSLSSGTTPTTNRSNVVALAFHRGTHPASNPGMTLNFSGHTNGFTEIDEVRQSLASTEVAYSWSWLFDTSTGTFETTATVNNSSPAAGDNYHSLIAVYAAADQVDALGSTLLVY